MSDEVEAILTKALAVDPRRRYASLTEMWDAVLLAVPESAVARFSERPRPAAPRTDQPYQPPDLTTAKFADGSPSRPSVSAKTGKSGHATNATVRPPMSVGFTRLVLGVALGAIGTSAGFVFSAPRAVEATHASAPADSATSVTFTVTKPAAPVASAPRPPPRAR